MDKHFHWPRLYVNAAIIPGGIVDISDGQSHYLKNVMRCQPGDFVRVFNGRDGEMQGRIQEFLKHGAHLNILSMIRPQTSPSRRMHVMFTPLVKDRLDFVIEKCVELGATDLHPIVTDHSDIRKINNERVRAQIIEAAEQCERLTVPTLHDLMPIDQKLSGWNDHCTVFVGVERAIAPLIRALPRAVFHGRDCAILVGPAGGFSADEKEWVQKAPCVQPVSLGNHILRADTAIIAMLAILQLKGDDHEL